MQPTSSSSGFRLQYRDYWIEVFIDDDGLFEPNIECPDQSGVVSLRGESELVTAIDKAKRWIEEDCKG